MLISRDTDLSMFRDGTRDLRIVESELPFTSRLHANWGNGKSLVKSHDWSGMEMARR